MTIGRYQHLSSFSKVKEIYENDEKEFAGYRSVSLIVPAVSGRRYRYHVYRLDLERGDLIMIGNELDIDYARAIARRSRNRDWKPLTDAELAIGRWPRERWERKGRSKWRRFAGPKERA